jgi:hypothetical protein
VAPKAVELLVVAEAPMTLLLLVVSEALIDLFVVSETPEEPKALARLVFSLVELLLVPEEP